MFETAKRYVAKGMSAAIEVHLAVYDYVRSYQERTFQKAGIDDPEILQRVDRVLYGVPQGLRIGLERKIRD